MMKSEILGRPPILRPLPPREEAPLLRRQPMGNGHMRVRVPQVSVSGVGDGSARYVTLPADPWGIDPTGGRT